MKPLKKILYANLPVKISSLILGYALWSMLSATHTAHYWLSVPLCFFNVAETTALNAPETIQVCLAGKRHDLWHLNTKDLVAHIDMSNKTEGTHPVTITKKNLLLPESIQLVNYIPSNLIIDLTEKHSLTT